jgi:hypothetical protein
MQGAVVSTLVTYGISFVANCGMAAWIDRTVARLEPSLHG